VHIEQIVTEHLAQGGGVLVERGLAAAGVGFFDGFDVGGIHGAGLWGCGGMG